MKGDKRQKAERTTYPATREQAFGYKLEERSVNGKVVQVKVYPPQPADRRDVIFSELFGGHKSIPGGSNENRRKPRS